MDLTWDQFKPLLNPVGICLHETMVNSANMRYPDQTSSFIITLNSLLQFTVPATLSKMLQQIAEKFPDDWGQILSILPNSLRMSMIHSSCYAAFQGWETWMVRIVDHLKYTVGPSLNILTNTAVTRLTPGNTVEIEDQNGKIYHFDVAIITSRPKETRQYVDSPKLKQLFCESNCPTVWTRSVLVESESPVLPPIPGSGLGFWILEPYATWTGTNPKKSLNYYTGCNKQNPSKERWMCFSNSDGPEQISPDAAWEIGKDQLIEFGFGNPQKLTEYLSNWPVYPKAGLKWYEKAGRLQGQDNVFIGGEVMSGATIESVIDYVYKAVPNWFTIVQKPEGI